MTLFRLKIRKQHISDEVKAPNNACLTAEKCKMYLHLPERWDVLVQTCLRVVENQVLAIQIKLCFETNSPTLVLATDKVTHL